MAVVVRTDKGNIRPINEDSYFAPRQGLPMALVADGIGGHKAGEVASALAVETMQAQVAKRQGRDLSIKMAVGFVRKTNKAIFEAAQGVETAKGMGTTLTMLYFMKRKVLLAHVGDSRAYRLRDGQLTMLSQDHSLVAELIKIGEITEEQAKDHPYKNIITRALGVDEDVQVDSRDFDRFENDLYLLCTDGLTTYLDDEELRVILLGKESLDEKADSLMNIALERGGRDNITLVLTDGEVGA